jgi:hypothetical protein
MVARKKWSELGTGGRALIVVLGAVELVLLAAALVDIRRRPADQIRGSKRTWQALAFVNIVGPLSYFAFGRRRDVAAGV